MKFKNIAIVHDDLVQWGGAERVLLELCELFPQAPIFTSVFDRNNQLLNQRFKDKDIHTSFLQQIPGWKSFYKAMLPLYPLAFEQFDFSQYDLVITQTTRFAKSIITKPETLHICYIHTPPRFLWNLSGEKNSVFLTPFLSLMRLFDQISAKRVDKWIAGSINSQKRLKRIYGVDSVVVAPFVDDLFFEAERSFNGGYYLIIARLNKYKNVDLAIELFNKNGQLLKIIGQGPELSALKSKSLENIEFYESLPDRLVHEMILGAKALIVTGEEDFGLTPLEAQAAGKGVVAFKKGGTLETVVENKTGVFFEDQTVESLKMALEKFEKLKIKPQDCINVARSYSKSEFLKKFEMEIENS